MPRFSALTLLEERALLESAVFSHHIHKDVIGSEIEFYVEKLFVQNIFTHFPWAQHVPGVVNSKTVHSPLIFLKHKMSFDEAEEVIRVSFAHSLPLFEENEIQLFFNYQYCFYRQQLDVLARDELHPSEM